MRRKRLVGIIVARRTHASRRQSGLFGMLDDQPREPLAPAAVEAVGLGVFVDQPLEFARVAGQVRRR